MDEMYYCPTCNKMSRVWDYNDNPKSIIECDVCGNYKAHIMSDEQWRRERRIRKSKRGSASKGL